MDAQSATGRRHCRIESDDQILVRLHGEPDQKYEPAEQQDDCRQQKWQIPCRRMKGLSAGKWQFFADVGRFRLLAFRHTDWFK